ncbi:MAG: flagellar biosynthetic protein FliO [Azospirillaceae bacterium]|nr:flagellar biosynthetic protein FliO [Azospirillaceae bacterium]
MDLTTYLRFLLALAFVLALLLLAALGLRRLGYGTAAPRRGRLRRLGIVEVTALDTKRRLVLIRRDGVEHLLLLGGPNDQVIEANIPAAPEAAN